MVAATKNATMKLIFAQAAPEDNGSVAARFTHSTGTGCQRRATSATGPAASRTQPSTPRVCGGQKTWAVQPASAAPGELYHEHHQRQREVPAPAERPQPRRRAGHRAARAVCRVFHVGSSVTSRLTRRIA